MKRSVSHQSDSKRKVRLKKENLSDKIIGAEEAEFGKSKPVGEDDENPFNRLPDELIVRHIFDKIPESRYLCSCSLVSKHFSYLIFQSHKVYLKIPLPISHQTPESLTLFHGVASPALRFLQFFLQDIMKKSPMAMDIKCAALHITKFLMKFKSLKSLYLELGYSGNKEGLESLIKWQGCSRYDGLVLLIAKRLDSARDNSNYDPVESNIIPKELLVDCLTDAFIRSSILEMIVPLLSTELEHVVFLDPNKQETISMTEADLNHLRNPIKVDCKTVTIKGWVAPVLKLPVSGCIMKAANLFMFKSNDELDDQSLLDEVSQSHEIFREAVMELVKTGDIGCTYEWDAHKDW